MAQSPLADRGSPGHGASVSLFQQLKAANQEIARLQLGVYAVVSLEEVRAQQWLLVHQNAGWASPSTPSTNTSGKKRPRFSTSTSATNTSPSSEAPMWSAGEPRASAPSCASSALPQPVSVVTVNAASQTGEAWPDSPSPAIAELSGALTGALAGAAVLRTALGDAVAQLEAALGLVAGIPPLAARCAELEALVDETQLLARIAGTSACSCGSSARGIQAPASLAVNAAPVVHEAPHSPTAELCGVGAAVGSDFALPTAGGDASSALQARLALTNLELQHAKGVAAELQAQVKVARDRYHDAVEYYGAELRAAKAVFLVGPGGRAAQASAATGSVT